MSLSADEIEILVGIEIAKSALLTEEQNRENGAKFQAQMAEAGFMDKMTEQHTKLFEDADKDGDGFLNFEEWLDFCKTSAALGESQGYHAAAYTQEQMQTCFDIYKKNGGNDAGLAKDTIFTCAAQAMGAIAEKMKGMQQ